MPLKNNTSISAGLKELDSGAIDFILKKDLNGFATYIEKTEITICGRNAIKIALALPMAYFKAEKIFYDTSGNITGDYTNSVSYASILFCGSLKNAAKASTGSTELTPDDKRFLIKTARENIVSWLKNGKGIILPKNISNNCMLNRGAFVTLKMQGNLRGCIGYFIAEKPLIQTILDNSYNAAFRDLRFMPLQPEELKDISIEISVLTDPVLVKSVNEIRTGRDGLIIENGMRRGLLLPQVAVEQGWDRGSFLSNTCLKAGLPPGAWKESATKIYRFQAIVFGEEVLK
jgi:AmmeMemoRadiSam system protein A